MSLKILVVFVGCVTMTLATEASLQEFTSGNNLFTASVYKEIRKNENGNFLVSPYSAEAVLALAQSGAKDETAQEIKTALHLPSQEKIEAAIKSLQPTLRQNDRYLLQTANKIYVKNNFTVNEDFKKLASDVFDANLENIDFEKKAEAANTMNQWVEEHTNNKIKNLIDQDQLNTRTRLVLINALYFKGNWSVPFEKYLSGKQKFYKTAQESVEVATMRDSSTQNYYESPELKAKFLELEFEGGDVSMTFVLPNEKEGLAQLENEVGKALEATKYTKEYVKVALPKFKIESRADFKDILQKLGVKRAFDAEQADLSGIAGAKGDLIIDKIAQKTVIDVNEEGVEAAASTFLSVGVPLSGYFPPRDPKEFIADHPFIFYIKVKDLVVFAGRVVDPTQ
jgi:serpin B